jgi:hypothetical protein
MSMDSESSNEGRMEFVLQFREPGTRPMVVTVPIDSVVSVEQGGTMLRILKDNVTIAVFNDVLLWRRSALTDMDLYT